MAYGKTQKGGKGNNMDKEGSVEMHLGWKRQPEYCSVYYIPGGQN